MSQVPSHDSDKQPSNSEKVIRQDVSGSNIEGGIQAISGSSNTQNQTNSHATGNTVNVNVGVSPQLETNSVERLNVPTNSSGCVFKLVVGGVVISVMVGSLALLGKPFINSIRPKYTPTEHLPKPEIKLEEPIQQPKKTKQLKKEVEKLHIKPISFPKNPNVTTPTESLPDDSVANRPEKMNTRGIIRPISYPAYPLILKEPDIHYLRPLPDVVQNYYELCWIDILSLEASHPKDSLSDDLRNPDENSMDFFECQTRHTGLELELDAITLPIVFPKLQSKQPATLEPMPEDTPASINSR